MARAVPKDAFEVPGGHGGTMEADGRTCRKAKATPDRAMTMSGPVGFLRSRCRPSGTDAVRCAFLQMVCDCGHTG